MAKKIDPQKRSKEIFDFSSKRSISDVPNQTGSLKKSITRKLILTGSTLGTLGGIGLGAWQAGRSRFSPKINGKLDFADLREPVEVIRDKWGVPHLYAANMEDLIFAQGFVQAQDRFWQMEFQRRLGLGRLAEVLGQAALSADKVMRRFDLLPAAARDYEVMPGEERALLKRFSAGVNAFLDLNKLPLEFSILRYKPEEWRPLDSLVWSKVLAIGQSGNFEAELVRARLIQKIGPEKAAQLEPFVTEGLPLIVPVGIDYTGIELDGIIAEFERLHELSGVTGAGSGSNNWVIDGTRSVTGKPLLANDPHISTSMPGVWYEMHLSAPDYEVAGVTVPGVPFVIMGHNRHIAWGVTNTMADYQDGFIEKVDPQNPGRYEYRGEWRDFESREETILVKGQPAMHKEYFSSVHGPIMSEFNPNKEKLGESGIVEKPIAVSWTLYEVSRASTAVLKLNRAHTWEEFREAVRNWDIPSLSFVYADTAGNIGFQFTGNIPIRKNGLGMLPSPGWTGEYDWQGFVPFDELPSVYNPESHLIFSANNRMVGSDYPYHLSSEYVGGWRAKRIKTLLEEKARLSLEDFRQIQTDWYSEPGRIFVGLMVEIEPRGELSRQALDYFKNWDGQLSPDSVAAALYKVTIYKVLRSIFVPMLGEPLAAKYMGEGEGLAPLNIFSGLPGPMVIRLAAKNDTALLPDGTTWKAVLGAALDEAITELRRRLGDDMRLWQWGKLHTIQYNHPLGAVKPLDWVFNRGPQPIGGDTDTVWQTGYSGKEANFTANGPTASFRALYDLANLDRSLMSTMVGQSGSPFSPHYFDGAEEWIEGQLHPLLFNRADVAENCAGTLILNPSKL